jgi:hypothetical protein
MTPLPRVTSVPGAGSSNHRRDQRGGSALRAEVARLQARCSGPGVARAISVDATEIPGLIRLDRPTAAGTNRSSASHEPVEGGTDALMLGAVSALGGSRPDSRQLLAVASIGINLHRSVVPRSFRGEKGLTVGGTRCSQVKKPMVLAHTRPAHATGASSRL